MLSGTQLDTDRLLSKDTTGDWVPTAKGFMKQQEDGVVTLLIREGSERWCFSHLVQGCNVPGPRPYKNENLAALMADIHHATHSESWQTSC